MTAIETQSLFNINPYRLVITSFVTIDSHLFSHVVVRDCWLDFIVKEFQDSTHQKALGSRGGL
jgi:hypothetical protein